METPGMERAKRTMRSFTQPEQIQRTLETAHDITPTVVPLVVGGTIALSAALFFSGRRWESLFVGLWAPTILAVGMFYRLFGLSGGEH